MWIVCNSWKWIWHSILLCCCRPESVRHIHYWLGLALFGLVRGWGEDYHTNANMTTGKPARKLQPKKNPHTTTARNCPVCLRMPSGYYSESYWCVLCILYIYIGQYFSRLHVSEKRLRMDFLFVVSGFCPFRHRIYATHFMEIAYLGSNVSPSNDITWSAFYIPI